MSKLKRFIPLVACYHNEQYWSPDSDDVLVAEKAPEHFEEIGKNKNADVEEVGQDSMTSEERAAVIRKVVAAFDKGNPDLFTGSGKPKVEAVEQAVKFNTDRKEIEAALESTGSKSEDSVLG